MACPHYRGAPRARTASRHTHAHSAACENPHSTSTARSVYAMTRASTSRERSGNVSHASNRFRFCEVVDGITVCRLRQAKGWSEWTPITPQAVEAALIAAFPDWAAERTRADGADQTMLAGPGDRGAVDVSYSPQMVTTTCYGMEPEQWNVVISAVVDLGSPMYDPQISYRFDGYE